MKYVRNPTLQQMTLVKAAEELWNRDNIRNLITNFKFSNNVKHSKKKWQKVEDQVLENVSQLALPELLKNNLLSIIRPIGRQIKAWCTYHHRKRNRLLKLPEQFCWTLEGIINRKRTAEMLVKDENLTLDTRYMLACIYCLENELPEQWNQISELQMECFYIKENAIKLHELVKFWSYQLSGQTSEWNKLVRTRSERSNPHVYAFQVAVLDGNPVATEFFFRKLNSEDHDEVLVDCAGSAATIHHFPRTTDESYCQVFHFLLSRMTEDQQIQTLTKFPHNKFRCFLEWPFQPLFMASAKPIMHSISEYDGVDILALIAHKITHGWTDFDYRQLFHDFWDLIPLDSKRRSVWRNRLFFELLESEEEEILKSMFKDVDAFEKEWLILSEYGLDLCVKFIVSKKWRSLEMLIELCGPSKEAMVRLLEGLMERALAMEGSKYKRRWKTFNRLFNDIFAKKCEKRKAEDDDINPTNTAVL